MNGTAGAKTKTAPPEPADIVDTGLLLSRQIQRENRRATVEEWAVIAEAEAAGGPSERGMFQGFRQHQHGKDVLAQAAAKRESDERSRQARIEVWKGRPARWGKLSPIEQLCFMLQSQLPSESVVRTEALRQAFVWAQRWFSDPSGSEVPWTFESTLVEEAKRDGFPGGRDGQRWGSNPEVQS